MPAAAEPLMAVSSTAASTEPPAGVASSSAWAAGKPRSLMTVASSAAPPAAAAAAKAALTSEQHQVGNGKEQEEDAVVLLPDDDECQLCMEPLDEDEVFMPCPCGYAVRVPHCCPLSRVLMSFFFVSFFWRADTDLLVLLQQDEGDGSQRVPGVHQAVSGEQHHLHPPHARTVGFPFPPPCCKVQLIVSKGWLPARNASRARRTVRLARRSPRRPR